METITEPFDPYASVTGRTGAAWDAASVANDAIFDVLSTARHNCHVRITDAKFTRTSTRTSQRGQPRPGPRKREGLLERNVGPNGDNPW